MGDIVPITVHVLDGCEYVDADTINVTVDYTTFLGRDLISVQVPVERRATGIYEGVHTIRPEDLNENQTRPLINARVERDGASTWAQQVLFEYHLSDLEVETVLEDGGLYIPPGENRTISWHVTLDGHPVDANITVGVLENHMFEVVPLDHVALGHYRSTYMMPESMLREHANMAIKVRYNTTDGVTLEVLDKLFFMSNLHVWAKRVWLTESQATFDIHVSDRVG